MSEQPDRFVAVVREMREAQKRFFASRSPGQEETRKKALADSRRLEAEVDRLLAHIDAGQERLF